MVCRNFSENTGGNATKKCCFGCIQWLLMEQWFGTKEVQRLACGCHKNLSHNSYWSRIKPYSPLYFGRDHSQKDHMQNYWLGIQPPEVDETWNMLHNDLPRKFRFVERCTKCNLNRHLLNWAWNNEGCQLQILWGRRCSALCNSRALRLRPQILNVCHSLSILICQKK